MPKRPRKIIFCVSLVELDHIERAMINRNIDCMADYIRRALYQTMLPELRIAKERVNLEDSDWHSTMRGAFRPAKRGPGRKFGPTTPSPKQEENRFKSNVLRELGVKD